MTWSRQCVPSWVLGRCGGEPSRLRVGGIPAAAQRLRLCPSAQRRRASLPQTPDGPRSPPTLLKLWFRNLTREKRSSIQRRRVLFLSIIFFNHNYWVFRDGVIFWPQVFAFAVFDSHPQWPCCRTGKANLLLLSDNSPWLDKLAQKSLQTRSAILEYDQYWYCNYAKKIIKSNILTHSIYYK